jgi:hypothetical protein
MPFLADVPALEDVETSRPGFDPAVGLASTTLRPWVPVPVAEVWISTPEFVVELILLLEEPAFGAAVAPYFLSHSEASCRTFVTGAEMRLPKPLEKSTSEPRRADDVAVKGSHRRLSISIGLG